MSREDDYTDEPPRRRRREEEDDDLPRGRGSRDRDYDEDDDDRPRRRRYRDDDDFDVRRRPRQLDGIDGMFANTNIVLLVLFPICASGIALILGIIGLAVCKDEGARQRALMVTILAGLVVFAFVVVRILIELK